MSSILQDASAGIMTDISKPALSNSRWDPSSYVDPHMEGFKGGAQGRQTNAILQAEKF